MANHEGDLSLRSVLMNLRQQKLVDDQAIEQIEREFEEQKVVHHEPWFVKFLLAVGAWVAAICFLLAASASTADFHRVQRSAWAMSSCHCPSENIKIAGLAAPPQRRQRGWLLRKAASQFSGLTAWHAGKVSSAAPWPTVALAAAAGAPAGAS